MQATFGAAEKPHPTIYIRCDAPPSTVPFSGMIDMALILAAASGTRMHEGNMALHKALVPVGSVPIIGRICQILAGVGVVEAIVVIGYEREKIRAAMAGRNDLYFMY